jgi:hypothetical protein
MLIFVGSETPRRKSTSPDGSPPISSKTM